MPDFDDLTEEEQRRLYKQSREKMRGTVETCGELMGCEGVCTAWIVVAEFASHDGEDPCKTLWIDHAYHDNTRLVPWILNGMLETAMESLNS